MAGFKTVYEGGSGEIEEKKSRFIANVCPVHSEDEAAAFIAGIKKQYWDARHNCSAFVIGENARVVRSSDDGEPSGTAGKPILEVINGEGLYDVAVVVTRYFGGTLLGTGGLIRAYTQAAKEGLANSVIIEKKHGIRINLLMDYTLEGKVRYFFSENNFLIENSEYTDRVSIDFIIEDEKAENVKKELIELSGGKIIITDKNKVVFAEGNKEILVF